ncbi:MAG: glycosyltransferase family 4 protein [Flavobacteriaceae bacterium]|nr:glycosyltransferase family 4 protein [Flavobacteriaceae bacterium]
MKLLYIGNKLSIHGINATTVETLSEKFSEIGYQVVSVSNKLNFFVRMFEMMQTCLLEKNISYIIIDTYSTKAFWYAFFCSQIARLRGIKYIPFLHGGDLLNRLKSAPFLTKLIFKNAHINVAPSNYLKSRFQENGYSNIIFIPNTFEVQNYEFKHRENIQPNLLWVRALADLYNPKMALKVLALLKEDYPTATLTMIGPDKEDCLQELKDEAQRLGIKVNFTGKLSKTDWIKLSKESDIFINTTNFDNTPVSVMEAMALGLPIVSTNVGGLPYLLHNGETALLCNPNDVDGMTTLIKKYLNDCQLVNSITKNARLESEKWDWSVVKKEWIKILN